MGEVKAAEKTDASITCKKTVYKVAYGAKSFKILEILHRKTTLE